MATFFNRATLSYNDVTTTSNTVSGEIVGSLTVSKTALSGSYSAGDTVTYAVNVINSGTSPLSGLTLTDDLGAYPFGDGQIVPMTYVDGTALLITNGVPSDTVSIVGTSPLTVNDITVPAGGAVTLIYQATVNEFAPLSKGSEITNTVSLTSPVLGEVGSASETVTVGAEPLLSIEKALSPSTVSPNGQITYTFTIRNTGAAPAVATDNVILSDTFDPILSDVSVTYNGTPITSPDGYTYDTTTGEFNTVASVITVPAATYERDPVTGEWTTIPGIAVVTVTGTV